MIDFESYFQYGPTMARVGHLDPAPYNFDCACNDCRQNLGLRAKWRIEYDEDKPPHPQKDWCAEQYMLCPPRLLGYVLKDKRWAQIQVDNLKDIDKQPSETPLSRLQLADRDKTKNMLLEVVQGHSRITQNGLHVDDIVAKKGKGLVILLYGQLPPVSTCTLLKLIFNRSSWCRQDIDGGSDCRRRSKTAILDKRCRCWYQCQTC